MSSANNKNNDSLEDAFRRHMLDAETTPAPDVWSRIDHDLTVQENMQYKKRITFYRQLAAACFVLFVMAGSILAYQFNAMEGSADSVAIQEHSNAATHGLAHGTESAENEKNIAANPTLVQGNSAKSALASAGADQGKALGSEDYKDEEPAANLSRIAQHTTSGKRESLSAIDMVKNKKTETDLTLTNNLLAGSGTERTSGISDKQNRQPVQTIAEPSAFKNNPATFSLLAKDALSSGTFALENKQEAQKQTTALAQELNSDLKESKGTDKAAGNSRWSMSMAYMPTYFAQNIGVPDPLTSSSKQYSLAMATSFSEESFANMEKALDEYENNTTPVYSYAIDLKTGFKIGKKVKLLAGVGFSQNIARTNTNYVVEQLWSSRQSNRVAPVPPTTVFQKSLSSGFATDSVSVSQTDPFNVDHRYRMVSLPIGLQFEDGITNGWNWYVAGGIAANIMVESSIVSSRKDIVDVTYNDQDESPFRYTHLSGNIGLGVSKQVAGAVSIALGPEFKGFFNTMLSDSHNVQAPQGKPYAIGLNMSLNYQLGR